VSVEDGRDQRGIEVQRVVGAFGDHETGEGRVVRGLGDRCQHESERLDPALEFGGHAHVPDETVIDEEDEHAITWRHERPRQVGDIAWIDERIDTRSQKIGLV